MSERELCIVVCEEYQREIETVITSQYPNVSIATFAPLCFYINSASKLKAFQETLQHSLNTYTDTYLIGGECLSGLADVIPDSPRLQACFLETGLSMVADPALIHYYKKSGAYIFTPGMIEHWYRYWEPPAPNSDTIRQLLGDASHVVLFDTGVDCNSQHYLASFAAQVDLPYSIIPIGLSHFRLFLHNIILEWQLVQSNQQNQLVHSSHDQQFANYDMALDLIGDMTRMQTEGEVIDSIFDLFAMMYAPQSQVYIPLHGSIVSTIRSYPPTSKISEQEKQKLLSIKEEYAWTENGNGFVLRITQQDEVFGILQVEGFAFPKYREHYLNLGLMLVKVCGLAIKNARTYEELQMTLTELHTAMEQLRKARDDANAANRAKSAFLATMSHEIRTPLNAIIGMTELLLDTSLNAEQRDFAETVHTSGQALLALINSILEYSKIEAGRLKLSYQPFDLQACIEESLDLVLLKADQKNINLAYDYDEHTPTTIMGDQTRVRQILFNLLSNAVKFTDNGEVLVQVKSEFLEEQERISSEQGETHGDSMPEKWHLDHGEWSLQQTSETGAEQDDHTPFIPSHLMHIWVRDTGIGMPASSLHLLFQSFSQLDSSSTRKYEGTGLGLAISKQLATLMGGNIEVESKEGKGSTFHVTFLASPAEESCTPILTQTHNVPEYLANKHILIFSDQFTNCELLEKYTTQWGMYVTMKYTLLEIFTTLYQNNTYDMVLLDLNKIGKSLVSILTNICTHLKKQHTLLIAYVPITMQNILLNQENFTFDALLTRPIKPRQLEQTLIRIIEQGKSEVSLAKATEEQSRETDKREKVNLAHVPSQTHPSLRILLAEDNLFNQKVTLHMLDRMGYRADIANNGTEVLEKLQTELYNLILMDVQMPHMDGLQTTQHIRTNLSQTDQPYIIAMTANAMEGDREMCLNAGMNDYVSKPVQMKDLAAAIDRVQHIV